MIDYLISVTLEKLVRLEDVEGKIFSPEWHRLEGYYYGLLDSQIGREELV